MLIGLGHDLQRVRDVEAATALLEPGLFFTEAEVARLKQAASPAESIAAAFSAKEALFKALPPIAGWFWTDAETGRDSRHAPVLLFHGALADHMHATGARATISLSHSGGFASAVVLITAPSTN